MPRGHGSKEVFIPLSHRFIVTAAHPHSPLTYPEPTLLSSQGQDADSNQIPLVERSIFFSHSCSYPLQNNGCFVDRCSTHPLSSVTNTPSLGFLYQLGYCDDKVLFLSKTRACVIEQIITIQQGRKMSSSQKDPFTLHLPRRAYLIFFFFPSAQEYPWYRLCAAGSWWIGVKLCESRPKTKLHIVGMTDAGFQYLLSYIFTRVAKKETARWRLFGRV